MSETPKPFDIGDRERAKLQQDLDNKKLIQETFDDLSSNPKYKEFYDEFHPGSIDSFIKGYANNKAQFMQHGEMFIKQEEDRAVQFREDAEKYLWLINQKKLFNIQCLWRAGKIVLEGVESVHDFEAWEADTKRCPFLEPITRDEFEVLKKSIYSDHDFDLGPLIKEGDMFSQMMFRWQGYDEFKKYYNEHGESPFPDWYKYYDMHFGTGDLFLLEDLRGWKEERYLLIGHDFMYPDQKILEKHPEIELPYEVAAKPKKVVVPAVQAPVDKRPMLSYDESNILNFMKEFGVDNEVIENGEYFLKVIRNDYEERYDTHRILDVLIHADELVPMKANWNWEEGLLDAMRTYENKKVLEVLEDVFGDYLMRKENNIPLNCSPHYVERAEMALHFANMDKAKVMAGRKICGEPEDFNF